jgi:V8-like Glu-specific endopeptidase
LPGSSSEAAEASTTIAPPLTPSVAASIFKHDDPHTGVHEFIEFTTVGAPPLPTAGLNATAPKPRPVAVELPSDPTQSTAPELPGSGGIQVQPKEKIPIQSVLGNNRTSGAHSLLGSRQTCSEPDTYCCPDPRYLNENTNFPYNVIGKIITPIGSCTGTLVGPRLVLTAAHCINCKLKHPSASHACVLPRLLTAS